MYAFEANQTIDSDPTWIHEDYSSSRSNESGDMVPIYHRTRDGAEAAMRNHPDYRLHAIRLRVVQATPCGEHIVID